MKLLVSLLFCVLVVQAAEYEKCVEGTTWMMDCNSCSCMNGFPVCTEMACPYYDHAHKTTSNAFRAKRSEELVVKPYSYKDNCKPGDTWMDEDCNRCTCDDIHNTVKAACTRRSCPGGSKLTPTPGWENLFNINEQHDRRKRSIDYGVVKDDSYLLNCRPGDTWTSQNCNYCSCDKRGVMCTANICPDGKKLTPTPGWENMFNIVPDLVEKRAKRSDEMVVKHNSYKQNCKVGDRWKDQDCNRCWCGDDLTAVCTKRKCGDGQKLEPTPGWENIFNIKQEEPDRRKRSLSSGVIKPDSYSSDCKLGDRWTDQDCNECYCNGKSVCTRRLCSDGKKLTPTSGWENIFNIDEEIVKNHKS